MATIFQAFGTSPFCPSMIRGPRRPSFVPSDLSQVPKESGVSDACYVPFGGRNGMEREERRTFSLSNLRRRSCPMLAGYQVAGRISSQMLLQTKEDSAAASTGSKPGHELLLFEALREGLEEEMERDPRVCIMGGDVGHYGGSYEVSKGLAEKFGNLRVLDTPITENSFTGMGIGSAITGLRPLVEGMNMGFLLLAFNLISNNCGMLHYTSGGQFKIPIIIRGPGGVGRQLGA